MLEVAAAIIKDQERLLICQRNAVATLPLHWEFPGGKRHAGETMEQCLIRECFEELGVTIEILSHYGTTEYTYPEQTVHLSFYMARIADGQMQLLVHQDARWVESDELSGYLFCPADEEIVRRLQDEGRTCLSDTPGSILR